MLLIDEVLPTIPYTPEGTQGVTLHLQPIEPATHDALVAGATKDGRLDVPAFYGAVAVKAIASWEGVGEGGASANPTDDRKERFGRRFAHSLMPGVLKKATDLIAFAQEIDQAKNG